MRLDTLPSGATLHTNHDPEREDWFCLVPYRLEGHYWSLGPTIDMGTMLEELATLGLDVMDEYPDDEFTEAGALVIFVHSATGYDLEVQDVWAQLDGMAAVA